MLKDLHGDSWIYKAFDTLKSMLFISDPTMSQKVFSGMLSSAKLEILSLAETIVNKRLEGFESRLKEMECLVLEMREAMKPRKAKTHSCDLPGCASRDNQEDNEYFERD